MEAGRTAVTCVHCAARLAVAAWAVAGLLQSASAEEYPSRPIQLVTSSQSGATEGAVRAWMACVSGEKLANQAIVLQTKPGANGVVAATYMRQQPNDGYTIMLGGMSNTTITPFTFRKPPYDPEKEFEGAAMFGAASLVMVASAQSGITNVETLKHAAATAPKGIDVAIPSIAGAGHMLAAAVVSKLKLHAELVSTKGEAGAITSLLGGDMPLSVVVEGTALPQVRAGKLVPVMVFADTRLDSMAEVPTVVEALGGASLAHSAWIGIATKAGGPPEVVRALERWTRTCMEDPVSIQGPASAGFRPRFAPANEYARIVREDISFWKGWIERLGISND